MEVKPIIHTGAGHAYYSAEMERLYGSVVWKDLEGKEHVITAITDPGSIHWPDVQDLGPAHGWEYVRRHREVEMVETKYPLNPSVPKRW